jgi:hypothetical protein
MAAEGARMTQDADDEAARALFKASLNPTGWPLLHLVAVLYRNTAEEARLTMTILDDGDWEVVVPFDGRLFRIDMVYQDPETLTRRVVRGADRHEEIRAGETVHIGGLPF